MKKKKKFMLFIICMICFVGIISHALWRFQNGNAKIAQESKLTELKKTAELNAENIRKDYTSKVDALAALAKKVAEMPEDDVEEIYSDVHLLSSLGFFDYVGISDREGQAVDSSGRKINISDREYFKEVMQGNPAVISDVLTSNVIQGDTIQIMAVPILKDKAIIGSIFGILNITTVSETLENTTGSSIHTKIVDTNGTPVTFLETDNWMTDYENVWEFYDASEFLYGSVEELRKNISDLKSGYYFLTHNNEKQITYYTPLGIEGYYIYSNLDVTSVKKVITNINKLTLHAIMEVTVALLALLAVIYMLSKKTSSELKELYGKAVTNEKIMQIAISNSDSFIFEYDSKKKILTRKAGEKHILFSEAVTSNVPDSILKQEMIDAQFIPVFSNAFEQIKYQENVRIILQTSPEYHSLWFEILMKNIYDEKHHIITTIGIIKNITDIKIQESLFHEAKRGQESLQNKVERDGVTGLYNATSAAEKINRILASTHYQGKHILIFMDLDNFKKINDTFGHQYGNQVLVELANTFSNKFRSGDIVARFGGDEFFAFLVDTRGFKKMEHVFQELVEECSKEYEQNGVKVSVSASFGIAVSPEHGTTFEELSHKADEMLLEVKRTSKKGYKLYEVQQ